MLGKIKKIIHVKCLAKWLAQLDVKKKKRTIEIINFSMFAIIFVLRSGRVILDFQTPSSRLQHAFYTTWFHLISEAQRVRGFGGVRWVGLGWEVPCFLPLRSVQFSPVTQPCLTVCNPMDLSTPGLPVHHQLPEFTQTHVH